jgi:hypothetical protein
MYQMLGVFAEFERVILKSLFCAIFLLGISIIYCNACRNCLYLLTRLEPHHQPSIRRRKYSERQQHLAALDDLRRRLDVSEEEERRKDHQLTALLSDQRPREPPAAPRRSGFLARLSGRS